jgi:hypothetical protein
MRLILRVTPAKVGIQDSWMPDRVRHDKARASGDFSQSRYPRRERVGSRVCSLQFQSHSDKTFEKSLVQDLNGEPVVVCGLFLSQWGFGLDTDMGWGVYVVLTPGGGRKKVRNI